MLQTYRVSVETIVMAESAADAQRAVVTVLATAPGLDATSLYVTTEG